MKKLLITLAVIMASGSAYSFMSASETVNISDTVSVAADNKASYALGYALGEAVVQGIIEAEEEHDYIVRRDQLMDGIRDRINESKTK